MISRIDRVIDSLTMYRLVLYVLVAELIGGAFLAAAGQLAFSWPALFLSIGLLIVISWAANKLLGTIFSVPTNVESSILTALILALILDPPHSPNGVIVLGWAAILAMGSKYILALHHKHIFNPAAIAALAVGVGLKDPASWWIGTGYMLPLVALGGLLIVRKVRAESMVGSFLLAALVAETVASLLQRTSVAGQLQGLVVDSPLLFFGSVMLTEPLTAPPTAGLKNLYGALTGVLYTPQLHLGPIYSTPELALVLANLYAYLVSPKEKFILTLRRKTRLSPDTFDFAFSRPRTLAFAPGQYMEWTLGYPRPDSRGNRRYFTIASSPTEPQLHLGVKFYEHGSSFKRALLGLNNRASILAGQIAGDFTLPDDPDEKLAFLAGGIGVTPFRSMLKYLIDTRERRDIVVLYANRTADDIVYEDILREAYQKLGISTVFTLTDSGSVPRRWDGCVGRIDGPMIAEVIPDYRERTFYLSGPPAMVRATEGALRELGVHRSRIKKDFFAGLS